MTSKSKAVSRSVFSSVVGVSCILASAGQSSAGIVEDWNQAALNAIAASSAPPPRASRTLAMLHVAMYDAVNCVDRTHAAYRFDTVPGGPTSMEAGAAQSAFAVLTGVFGNQPAFTSLLNSQLGAIPASPAKDAGVLLGASVASATLSWRGADGSTAPSTYQPQSPAVVGRWRPTGPAFAAAALPQWKDVTPFGMASPSQFRPGPTPALTSAEYATAFNQVKDLGRSNSATRTQEQTDIARVWQGGAGTPTPPGQWNQITQQIAQSRALDLTESVRLFAQVNVALADAAIGAWDAKYTYDTWRPVSAIADAALDGNAATDADATWTSFLVTPNHPDYVSGHSTFSRAAAQSLTRFFGTDALSFTFSAADAPGITRNFTSVDAAANEAGLSRIYGGIHFSFANTAGQSIGLNIGDYVADHFFQPVPEPGPILLAVVGLLGLARRKR